MKKTVLNGASFYNQKYFLNPDFNELPDTIKDEIKIISVLAAQKLHCVFTIGFYDDGTLYFETMGEENDFDYDEIGAGLEIRKLEREKSELIKSLRLWYLYKNGKISEENINDEDR